MDKEKLEDIKRLRAITEVQKYYLEKLDLLPPEIIYLNSEINGNYKGGVVHTIEYDDQPYRINSDEREFIDCVSTNYQSQNYTFDMINIQTAMDNEEIFAENKTIFKIFKNNRELYHKLFTSLGNGKFKMNKK